MDETQKSTQSIEKEAIKETNWQNDVNRIISESHDRRSVYSRTKLKKKSKL